MAGMSITLCKVDAEFKRLFSAPATVPIRVF
jgi:dihydroxyacetone kinase